MKEKIVRDRSGVEIREGCTIRTKALSVGRDGSHFYESFKVTRIRGKLCVQKQIDAKKIRTFSVEYIQRWLKDDSMEVVETAPDGTELCSPRP